ncbi:MAG: hypothetical protein ABEK50_18750 [bacterium]
MKKPVSYIIACIIFLPIALVIAGCWGPSQPLRPEGPSVEVVNQNADCASGDTTPTTVEKKDSSYRIQGSITVSNPCHKLSVSSQRNQDVLDIKLQPKSQSGACVMCLGRLNYTLKVKTEARKIKLRRGDEVLLEKSLPN